MNTEKKNKYFNPYLGGFLLGLVVLMSFYFTGRGLGASGAVKSAVVATVNTISEEHTNSNEYYSEYKKEHSNPMKSWLVFEVFGVLIGAFISGAISGRLKFTNEVSGNITPKTRLIFALIGGLLFGFGAQLGRGCTSGAALSGMAVLSTAGFITMISIFGTGYVLAYFFRKLWLK